jgi:hypothetical protein
MWSQLHTVRLQQKEVSDAMLGLMILAVTLIDQKQIGLGFCVERPRQSCKTTLSNEL